MKHARQDGKWTVCPHKVHVPKMDFTNVTIVTSGRGCIAIITDNWIPEGMNEANAVLISKSPELLDIVIKLQKRLETLILHTQTGIERDKMTEENIIALELINSCGA